MVTRWPQAGHARPGVPEPSPGCRREEALGKGSRKAGLEAAEAALWGSPWARSQVVPPSFLRVQRGGGESSPCSLASAPFPSPFSNRHQLKV